ncbi:MAG TPA: hypothetical protein PLG90_04320 [Ignavibacteria bacterium]|nr:hypothetical protein [Ignavibacteria bacterium]
MKINKENIAEKILEYLQRKITFEGLVNWAENSIMNDEFDNTDLPIIKEIVGRIGLSDVKEFGINYDDLTDMLNKLNYELRWDMINKNYYTLSIYNKSAYKN